MVKLLTETFTPHLHSFTIDKPPNKALHATFENKNATNKESLFVRLCLFIAFYFGQPHCLQRTKCLPEDKQSFERPTLAYCLGGYRKRTRQQHNDCLSGLEE